MRSPHLADRLRSGGGGLLESFDSIDQSLQA